MSKIEPMEDYKVSDKELDEYCGGKKTEIPVPGTNYHTDTDCLQKYEVHHSFLGIKWKEKNLKTKGCSYQPSTGNRCPERCAECEYSPVIK